MTKKLLMDMTDTELMAAYRNQNDSTVHGTASYEAELQRRANNRYSGLMLWMTVASTTTSIVAVIISVMRGQ